MEYRQTIVWEFVIWLEKVTLDLRCHFDKVANELFEIHIHVDRVGFTWINLDSQAQPSVACEDDFEGVDEEARLQSFDMTQYHLDHTWNMLGDYNWKTLADNYNEICPDVVVKKDDANGPEISVTIAQRDIQP